ncbi:hypothetical protein BGZ67_001431 [Mortierella alpina]|nr:hypothetical protein BGZ67_001431 [Mortierella alpina]
MALTCTDIFKFIFAVILPPVGVFLERGCGTDLLINIVLTILGYIPGIIHAFYIILNSLDMSEADVNVLDNEVETDHHKYMRAALDLALEAHSVGEVPVGCVFVHGPSKEVIGRGRNRTNESLNGTRHAEFEGIDMILSQEKYKVQAEDKSSNFWKDIILYVTIEPCVMCASALRQLGIGQVYFGAGNDRFGGNGSVFHIHTDANLPHTAYPSEGGYYRGEAIMVLRKFYVGENTHAPEPKKKKHRVLKEDL